MNIVNIIKSIQGLDIAVAINLQLIRDIPETSCVTVLHMESPCIRVNKCTFLLSALASVCEEIITVGRSNIYDDLEKVRGKCRITNIPSFEPGKFDRLIRPGSILLRSHADIGPLASHAGDAVHKSGGRVFVYLEGCYPPLDSIPLPYFKGARPDLADTFLLYSEGHRKAMGSVGYSHFHLLGYPKLFPERKRCVRKHNDQIKSRKDGIFNVAIFTRGEFPGETEHIMPNETLATVLEQILDALEDLGRPLKVLVKPHPGQDQIFLASCLKDRPYAELSYEYPLLLSDNADLVVTTWSTTIIDALAMETPAIEFYPENNYFRTVYPAGSYTRQLGVPCVDNGSDFRLALRQVLAADYILPDPHEVMGDVVNFDIFRM